VIERRGAPAGRLYLEARVTQIHMVDIALLPELRGAGVGSTILQAVIDLAAAEGKGVGIFVERFNPALRLYQRFGFSEIADSGVYLEMERVPEAA
jgi:ribosomal protein S18 acetylase RimI-like enzyme